MSSAIARVLPRRRRARVEIIPLIDVIFFLLATFVLFTLSLNRIVSLDLELPESIPTPADDMLTVRLSDAGTMYWKDELITLAELPARLEQFKQSGAPQKIMIATEPGVVLSAAVQVLDAVRRAEGIQVTFDTRSAARPLDLP